MPLAGQGMRFLLSGGVVALLYLGLTSLLGAIIGLPFQLAIAIGFCTAISVHFSLQRAFVWDRTHGFALGLREQVIRYLVLAAIQYGATAAGTALLPSVLGVSSEVAYLISAAVMSAANFLMFRSRVFHSAIPHSIP
jgi:putative flippase GtrA